MKKIVIFIFILVILILCISYNKYTSRIILFSKENKIPNANYWSILKEDRLLKLKENTPKYCNTSSYAKITKTIQTDRIYYDETEQRMYCLPPKAGCTSFKEFLLKAKLSQDGKSTRLKYVHNIKYLKTFNISRYKSIHNKLKTQNYKLMLTRNPYTRLLSGFKDKIKSIAKGVGFVKTACKWLNRTCDIISGNTVSFPDFIQSIINLCKDTNPSKINVHFRPQYLLCRLCSFDYDFHIKLETISQDMNLLESKGFFPNISFPWSNPSTNSLEAMRVMFKTLTETQYNEFIKLYKLDFQLLGYDIIKYEEL